MDDMFGGLREQLKGLLWPEDYFSWQTLLLLSLFSLLTAAGLDAAESEIPFIVNILGTFSWMFFTAAVWWALAEKPVKVFNFSVSPWITGIVLCLFLFQPWTETRFRIALSSWPLLSTAIMALPRFVDWELKAKKLNDAAQQQLAMTLLINLLLSSWIMFHFRVQDWVRNYPTLLVSDLNQSSFVYDFAEGVRDRQPQGVPLLTNTADAIVEELSSLPWYQTERWLYTRQEQLIEISGRMLRTLYAPEEKIFWRMEVPEPQRLGDGYLLTLRAIWQGPVSEGSGFFLEKTCKILPVDRPRPGQSVNPSAGSVGQTTADNQPVEIEQFTSVSCGEDIPAEIQWIRSAP